MLPVRMEDIHKAQLLLGYWLTTESRNRKRMNFMNVKEQRTMKESQIPRITGLLVIEVRKSNPNGDPSVKAPRASGPMAKERRSCPLKRKLRLD